MYDVTRHLLMLGCFGSFVYSDTTEALQAGTEQHSGFEVVSGDSSLEVLNLRKDQYGKFPSTMPVVFTRRCAELSASLCQTRRMTAPSSPQKKLRLS